MTMKMMRIGMRSNIYDQVVSNIMDTDEIIHHKDEEIVKLRHQIKGEKKSEEVIIRLDKEIDKLENPTITLNDGNIDQFHSWAIKLLKEIRDGST